MLAVLGKGGSQQMLSRLMNLAKSEKISANGLPGIYRGIASLGGPAELRQILNRAFTFRPPARRPGRRSLHRSRRKTEGRPAGHFERRARGHERTAASAGA